MKMETGEVERIRKEIENMVYSEKIAYLLAKGIAYRRISYVLWNNEKHKDRVKRDVRRYGLRPIESIYRPRRKKNKCDMPVWDFMSEDEYRREIRDETKAWLDIYEIKTYQMGKHKKSIKVWCISVIVGEKYYFWVSKQYPSPKTMVKHFIPIFQSNHVIRAYADSGFSFLNSDYAPYFCFKPSRWACARNVCDKSYGGARRHMNSMLRKMAREMKCTGKEMMAWKEKIVEMHIEYWRQLGRTYMGEMVSEQEERDKNIVAMAIQP